MFCWVIGIGLLALAIDGWLSSARNPNRDIEVLQSVDGTDAIELAVNRQGHYVVSGSINGSEADFLLDTGATRVTISAGLAERAGLPRLGRSLARTANGTVEVYDTVIDQLEFGGMRLPQVKGIINPGMTDDDAVLLGMSALRRFDIRHSKGTMTLTKPTQ